jgi:hypothetical protein
MTPDCDVALVLVEEISGRAWKFFEEILLSCERRVSIVWTRARIICAGLDNEI